MVATSSGKSNVSVWHKSVCPSICPVFFLTLVGHAARRILNVTHQGAAGDAASVHFRPSIRLAVQGSVRTN